MDIDLGPVSRITADAVGPAGHRTFFLQGRSEDRLVTVLLEKQQVQLLAASIVEILAQIGKPTGDGPPEEAMGLEEPIIPEWRVGRLAISYVEDRDLILLEVNELVPDSDDEDDDEGEDDDEDDEDEDAAGEDRGGVDGADGEDGDIGDQGIGGVDDDLLGGPHNAVPEGEALPEPGAVRFWATREQMLALARHGAQVASKGRPTCRFCDQPIEPDGHVCAAMNGHRTTGDDDG